MDDLEIKNTYRNNYNKQFNGKSVMFNVNSYCLSKIHNDHYAKFNPNLITQFEEQIIELYPELITKCIGFNNFYYMGKKSYDSNIIILNKKFLFDDFENELNKFAINKKITYSYLYNIFEITYYLPITGQIEIHDCINDYGKKQKKLNSVMFNGKIYDSDCIYKLTRVNTLKKICDLYIQSESSGLPKQITKLEFSSTQNIFDKSNKYIRKHNCNINYTSPNVNTNLMDREYVEYLNDSELIKFISGQAGVLNKFITTNIEPIFIKINNKNCFNVTHIGILGSPINTYLLHKNKYDNIFKTKKQQYAIKNLNLLNESKQISYVTKFAIYYKDIISKKWIFLKNVDIKTTGIESSYKEEIISLNDNFNCIDGIKTFELKFVPIEYINNPTMRISIYGNIFTDNTKTNYDTSDKSDVTKYTVYKSNNKYGKYSIKKGGNYSIKNYNCTKNIKHKKNIFLQNEIYNSLYDLLYD